MKIALVTHNIVPHDGQGRVTRALVRYLSGQGHQVHLVAHQVSPEVCAWPGVTWHRIRLPLLRPNLLKVLLFAMAATWHLRHGAFDVVHYNGVVAFGPHQLNTIHFLHGGWLAGGFAERPGLRGRYHHLYHRINAWLEGYVLRRAGRVVGVSPKIAQEVQAIAQVGAERIATISNGSDPTGDPVGKSERSRIRQTIWPELGDDHLLIGFAGDLRSSIKGLDTLFLALKRPDLDRVHLMVAGALSGSPYPALAAQLGLAQRVRFLGFRTDLGQVMTAWDAFVFPTRYDPFGLVVTEAAAAGCPLLISGPAHCGAASLFTAGESAILLDDPQDAAELAVKLRLLCDDPALRARLGAGGRAAVAGWSWQQMGEAYARLYQQIGGAGA